ncbi:hypothetical protein TNCV_1546001 [Trichonephila clavipes]|nr:hypothetical protein TNCV_1546001 [Trichonephila clavipes]
MENLGLSSLPLTALGRQDDEEANSRIIPHPPLPQIQRAIYYKLPFNFSLDVKYMKISSSEVESPSGVS